MTKFDELVAKLKEIFQIDKPELDFGIYKILHVRAAEINYFLDHGLKSKVEEHLKRHGGSETKSALDAAKVELLQSVGNDALEPDGTVKAQYKAMPMPAVKNAVEKYESALTAYQAAENSLKNETEVYSRLLDFFKQYYEDGDFISKRRYRHQDSAYAIPYNGEEVKLHWANADQYYTKSGENFTNYKFTLDGGLKVEFKLISAETGKDNIKDNEAVRRFVLWDPKSVETLAAECLGGENGDAPEFPTKSVEEIDGTLEIYFQYLKIAKPKKGDTDKVTEKAFRDKAEKAIASAINGEATLRAKYQSLFSIVSKDDKRTLLRKHIEDYTAKNTSDYFIHKDLKTFLERELDYYVKTEMLKLDHIDEAATIKDIEANLHVIQAFRSIALVLIGFMAQLEDFQKKLWLKKKFVTSCEYCITLGTLETLVSNLKIAGASEDLKSAQAIETLIDEAKANPEQVAEWTRLGTDADPKAVNINAFDARMIDTKFFDENFKSKLLRLIPDLDEQCDGLLIHSENFQALNFLHARYSGRIDNIYIDPPYNSKTSEILYKNSYKHSSWLSLMFDRLSMLEHYGDIPVIVAIDENEQEVLGQVLSIAYPRHDKTCVSVIHNKKGIQGDFFSFCHEFAYFSIPSSWKSFHGKKISKDNWEYNNLRKWGSESERDTAKNCFYPIFVKDGLIVGFGDVCKEDEHPIGSNVQMSDGVTAVYPIDESGVERKWRYARESVESILYLLKVEVKKKGEIQIHKAVDEEPVKTVWTDNRYIAGDYGTKWLSDMGIKVADNLYPKSLETVKDCLYTISENGSLTMDFFAGSGTTGHAVIALNRLMSESGDQVGGCRRYVLVEMGDHFETVLKPRLIKAVYSPDWKDGKPTSTGKGISHCFKYMTLESYEDALNNIELKRTAEQEAMLPGLKDDQYLLKYFLEKESSGSIISTDDFRKPFDYELKIAYESSGAARPQKIDLVETFNYLIGLKVDSYVRRFDKGYCYLDGTLPDGEHALVFWRDCDKLDAAALNKELEKLDVDTAKKKATFDVIYVNGDHAVQNGKIITAGGSTQLKVRQIEAEFLEKMFACEEV